MRQYHWLHIDFTKYEKIACNKMKLELTITGSDKDQILKRMLTMTKYLIDEIGDYDTESIKYKLKK